MILDANCGPDGLPVRLSLDCRLFRHRRAGSGQSQFSSATKRLTCCESRRFIFGSITVSRLALPKTSERAASNDQVRTARASSGIDEERMSGRYPQSQPRSKKGCVWQARHIPEFRGPRSTSRHVDSGRRYFLRWRIFARIRRLRLPILRRPFPVLFVPMSKSTPRYDKCVCCE